MLTEEWLPKPAPLDHEEALAEIVSRYFRSHGPATVKDFAWWSGLRVADARLGLEKVSSRLSEGVVGGTSCYAPRDATGRATTQRSAYLLPAFDEYLVGYADRSATLRSRDAGERIRNADVVVHSNGIFLPTLVVNGTVAGVWKRTRAKVGLVITLSPFRKLNASQMAEVREQVESYGNFFETEAALATR